MKTYEWTIEQRGNFFYLRRDDGVEPPSPSRSFLSQALYPHRIIGDKYNEVCRQLNETGRAKVSVTIGGFRQL